MGGKWVRRIGIAAAAVVALVVVAVVAARIFVGSDRGRHVVERKIDRTVARATSAGGHVHIGHIAGSLVGGATLDDVEWRDRAGNVAMRARRVVARWSATRAIARRPSIELRVEAPFIDVDRLASGVDFDEAAHWLENKGEKIDAVTVSKLDVEDATLVVEGVRISGVRMSGGLGFDRVAGRLEAKSLAVRAGQSGATLSGSVARDAVDLRMTSLRVGPDDLRRLSPRAGAPRTPLVGEARIHGRLDDAMVRGELRPDRGRASWPARSICGGGAGSCASRSTTSRPTTRRRCSPATCGCTAPSTAARSRSTGRPTAITSGARSIPICKRGWRARGGLRRCAPADASAARGGWSRGSRMTARRRHGCTFA